MTVETEFYKKLCDFQKAMPPIFRNAQATVTKGGTKIPYATKDQILKQVRPVLNENGFSLFCLLEPDQDMKAETATWILAGHGHQISSCFRFGVVNESAQMWQQWGGAETYKSRKALCNLLGLDAGDESCDLDGHDPEATTFQNVQKQATPAPTKKNLKPAYTSTQTKPTRKVASHKYADPKLCNATVEDLRKATAGNDDQLEVVKGRFGAAFPDFLEMTHPSFSDFVKEAKHVEFLQEILIALKSGDLSPTQGEEKD